LVRTYVIAEIGINHKGDILLAEEMIRKAKQSGADAVKFQTYITEKRVKKSDPLFPILKESELSYENFEHLKGFADKTKIDFISTPFDIESLHFLLMLDIPKIKISSFQTTDCKLLKEVAKSKKSVIVSTGMSNLLELTKVALIFKDSDLSFLHCISSYPVCDEDLNFRRIKVLKSLFDCKVGFSDHSGDRSVAPYSVAFGAEIVETHFMTYSSAPAPDIDVSLFEDEFSSMVEEIRRVEKMYGTKNFSILDCEKPFIKYRRFS